MTRRYCLFFFFFQAEDGIRDTSVTGVQTCALPIFAGEQAAQQVVVLRVVAEGERGVARQLRRSEERRVGKECRSRWPPYPYKKKKPQNRKTTASPLSYNEIKSQQKSTTTV